MNVYLISGLGADKRIFSKLKLSAEFNIVHIDWIVPFSNESLVSYAKRLSKVIDVDYPFALIGVSFGGMIAVEIAKIIFPAVTIIISSTIISKNIPFLYQIAGKLNLLKIVPAKWLKSSNKLTQNYFFGTKSNQEKILLGKIITDTDPFFLKWAIGSILNWKNEIRPKNLYHIHGTKDKILYSSRDQPDFIIENGSHFMVYQKAVEISAIIERLLLG